MSKRSDWKIDKSRPEQKCGPVELIIITLIILLGIFSSIKMIHILNI